MANIPIRNITQTGTPSASSQIVFDDGQMKRATVASLAEAIRPVASLGEAQAGTDNVKTMTPLRVKDSIASQIGVSLASKTQGDTANTALQPSNVGTTAGKLVQLDGLARLPAVDGSQLTGLPGGGDVLKSNHLTDVSVTAPGTGAVARTAASKLNDVISLKDFAVGDGVTDDTVAIQKAIDACAGVGRRSRVYLPGGYIWKTTAPLNIHEGQSIEFVGDNVAPYNQFPGYGMQAPPGGKGGGSWFYFAHSGKGFNAVPTSPLYNSGLAFRNLGTYRDQPTPTAGWAPNAHDFDFYFESCDVKFNNVCLWNPTKGISFNNSSGRLVVDQLFGQPLQVRIQIKENFDASRIENVHFWPYWSTDTNVTTYTLATLRAIQFFRADNPHLHSVFAIFHLALINCSAGATGNASKIHATNVASDVGTYGMLIDTGCHNVTGQFSNFSAYASGSTSNGIRVLGNGCHLSFSNLDSEQMPYYAMSVEGSGCVVSVANLKAKNFNTVGSGAGCIYVAAGSLAHVSGYADVVDQGGNGSLFSGPGVGEYYGGSWISYTPSISASSGAFAAVIATGRYKVIGKTVAVKMTITITTTGTAGTAVVASLPFASSSSGDSVLAGRENVLTGVGLQGIVNAGSGSAVITRYDNAFQGAAGNKLVVSGVYEIP